MTTIFLKGFDTSCNVSPGDDIIGEHDGFHFTATIHHDESTGAPWKAHDGHGIISEWEIREAKPGERLLCMDRSFHRFYDIDGSVALALQDGWGCRDGMLEGESRLAYARRAVEQDYANMKAWCDDEWCWVGVGVSVTRRGVELVGQFGHALWGIDSTSPDYLTIVANELAEAAHATARQTLKDLCTS